MYNTYIFTVFYLQNVTIALSSCFLAIIELGFLLITVKQDDENRNLKSRLKETEAEIARLQRTISVQCSQSEKYKALSQEASRKSQGLQQEVTALEKVVQMLVSFISQKGKSTASHPPSMIDTFPLISLVFQSLIIVSEIVI